MVARLTVEDVERRPVAIVGAGTLGGMIAATFIGHGADVHLFDISPAQLRAAASHVDAVVSTLGDGDRGQLTTSTSLADTVRDAWLIIEAVPERLDLKRDVFAQIDEVAPEDAILTTNSSSYRSSALADVVSQPERLMNTHFYHPPERNAVEVMTSGSTDPALIELVIEQLGRRGFRPFHVRQESTGFIYNRVWAAIKREALMVVATGVAAPEDVDALFRSFHEAGVGPFELMDRVGLDVVLEIEEHYAREREGIPEEPRQLLRRYITEGKLGVKSGEGFYRYE
ncbi:MAG: 3-hydroxyacyl-CoA dehydrogenase NAD-binding domain-containing protein [Thermomicrobiales bacterium]|nr:3-hydroxyacyl-CoA dehydrogenase NAD-binding domain-containing protein [Thermomicrobiales bacterium]